MSNEIKLGDIVVFKIGNRAFEVIGKYIVPDDRLWRVDAITENDPPTPDRNRKYRLVAVDCPNVMLDEIPEIYVESYSEKLERELEEQKKEALKMNRNEIKQGDRVRVSKDAPKLYTNGSFDMFYMAYDSEVLEVEDDHAVIKSSVHVQPTARLIIPTKYLVKVDAEAKEPRFKVGDKVKVNLPRSIRHNTIGTVVFAYASGNAVNVDFGDDNEPIYCDCGCLEPDTKPTEQTEAEKKPNHTIKIPVEVDLTDSYWDAYAADLAKEIVLKTVNSASDRRPMAIAAYATDIAKAVVEGLKRK